MASVQQQEKSTLDLGEEITKIMDMAKSEIENIEKHAYGQKTKIIRQLAMDLQGKIPIGAIASAIKFYLPDHKDLVNKVLPNKYKRKGLSEAGKKGAFIKQENSGFKKMLGVQESEPQVIYHNAKKGKSKRDTRPYAEYAVKGCSGCQFYLEKIVELPAIINEKTAIAQAAA